MTTTREEFTIYGPNAGLALRLTIEAEKSAAFGRSIGNRRPVPARPGAAIANRESRIANRVGFTLIELLVVIAIMAILASFTLVVVTQIKKVEYVNTATAELNQLETALENYKNKYGSYPPSNPSQTPLVNTLYYELTGVANTTPNAANPTYTTLDGACSITQPNYKSAFTSGGNSIDGVINCTKGTAEEGTAAQNFLEGIKANRIGATASPFSNGMQMSNLVTSVRGPDTSYKPFPGYADVNPFRYFYPGTNNPSTYDLYVQLKYRGTMYLVCNWSKNAIKNSPLP